MDEDRPPLDPQQRKEDMAKCPKWLLERLAQLVETKASLAEEIAKVREQQKKQDAALTEIKKKHHASEKKLKLAKKEALNFQKEYEEQVTRNQELQHDLASLRGNSIVLRSICFNQ